MKDLLQDKLVRVIISGAATLGLAFLATKVPALAGACTAVAGLIVPAAYKTSTSTTNE